MRSPWRQKLRRRAGAVIESLKVDWKDGDMCMSWEERVVIDPNVLCGKPVIKGTRLAVEFIVDLLAQGWTETGILKNYPGVGREDILACLAYASAVLHAEKVYPVSAQ